jgi:hypothetical protein
MHHKHPNSELQPPKITNKRVRGVKVNQNVYIMSKLSTSCDWAHNNVSTQQRNHSYTYLYPTPDTHTRYCVQQLCNITSICNS